MKIEITADKIKKAGHWCNQIFVLDQQYRLCKDYIKKQKGLGNKIGQVIFRWFSSIIVVLVVVYGILFYRMIQVHPTVPSDSKAIFYNELLQPAVRYLMIISLFYFPVFLYLGLNSVKRDFKKVVQKSDELKKRFDIIIKERMEIISIISEKYRYPLATSYLAEVIECGRADNMKEALKYLKNNCIVGKWKVRWNLF